MRREAALLHNVTAILALLTNRWTYYAMAAAAFAFVLWREHHATHRANQLAAEKATLTATLASERANRATEQTDRRKADEAAKSLEAELASIRNAPAPVSVYCRPARVPSAASEGRAAAGTAGSAAGPGVESPTVDVGNLVRDLWIEAQSNNARHAALIEWERNRTH